MKRKMLISIALITIMLLNCMMPILTVNAAISNGEEIQLNSKLYKAIKASLLLEGIVFGSDDITHTITISPEEKAKVVRLNLNESAISDLTGIEAFSEVTHLELSGNDLSKKSNLSVLNSLTKLNYLDLSTNKLEDVSDISDLISKLKTEGTIILSNQTITQVNSVYVDSEENSDNSITADFELPAILELAGYLKSSWKQQENTKESSNSKGAPYIETTKMPMYVNGENNLVTVTIADKNDGSGYYGMVKLTIYIYDDPTEAAQANNPNRAAENILNGSKFNLFYVVYDSNCEAITTMDSNLYKAIKEQLSEKQKINSDLLSYCYEVDSKGNIIYDQYKYREFTKNNINYHILRDTETGKESYAINLEDGKVYKYQNNEIGTDADITTYEKIEIRDVDADGKVTIHNGYKIPRNSNCRDLYLAAYDEAKTFVITDKDLANEITSLILNNKQIRDLSGLEYFIGLKSDLNVSHNYLSDINPLYKLQEQKDIWELQMIEQFSYWLKTRNEGNLSKSVAKINAARDGIENQIKEVEKSKDLISQKLGELSNIELTAEEKDKIREEINNIVKTITGYLGEDGEKVNGFADNIDEFLNDEEIGINPEIDEVYEYLSKLYDVYSDKYRLTTLLADDLNYMTYDEYETYKTATETSRDTAYELLVSQINYLARLESSKALSELDKRLLSTEFGIDFENEETETPLKEYFDDYLKNTTFNRTKIVNVLNTFREIGLYSEMANYCLIERMLSGENKPEWYCYEQDYLEKRIEELKLEDIPTKLEEDTLKEVKYYDEKELYKNATELFKVYNYYTLSDEQALEYYYHELGSNSDMYGLWINMCEVEYNKVENLAFNYETDNEGDIELPTNMYLKEIVKDANNIEYESGPNVLNVFDQLMSLANKLVIGNVERYVFLPDLKKLDVSYNADLDNLEGLPALASLLDLNAEYCYIADVTNVEWKEMKNLRKLNLGFNYISDITPLTELTKLKYLNLRNNLLKGKLELSEYQFANLFEKLEELDLSGNQIDDISSLIIYLDHITDGNYANYLAGKNTININLNDQNLYMEIENPIYLNDYPTTIDVELPKIFTQLLAIDTARTAFGINSQKGRIESEGKYVTLNTRTTGDKTAEVNVIAMTGNGTSVDTCIGEGTTMTIAYKVVEEKVTSVTVTPTEDVKAAYGRTLQFTSEVKGENLRSTDVIWSVEGATNEATTISAEGLLTVAKDEEATTLTVKATPVADRSLVIEIEVALVEEKVTSVTVTPNEDVKAEIGKTVQFTAVVEGENLSSSDVVWAVEGATSENTTISEEGILTVGEDEEATTLVVKATSVVDETMEATVEVAVVKEITNIPGTDPENPGTDPENPGTDPENPGTDPENPGTDPENPGTDPENPGTDPENPGTTPKVDVIDTATLGYKVGEEYLTGVSAKTPVEDFKTILLNGLEYNVVITKDTGKNAEVITEGNIATGMFVQIQDENGNVIKDKNDDLVVYEIVVKGDVNGDGLANSLDSVKIKAYRNEVIELTGSAFEAADIDNDGKVNVSDSKLLLYHRAEVTGYSLNYTK